MAGKLMGQCRRGAKEKRRLEPNQIARPAGLFGKGGWSGPQAEVKLIENEGRMQGMSKK